MRVKINGEWRGWPGELRSDVHNRYHTLDAVRRDRTEMSYLDSRESRREARQGTFRPATSNRRLNRAEYKVTGQVSALRRALVKPRGRYVGHWLHPELDVVWFRVEGAKRGRWVRRHKKSPLRSPARPRAPERGTEIDVAKPISVQR